MAEAFAPLQSSVLAVYTSIEAYPLYKKLTQRPDSVSTCDDIFARYLFEVAAKTNDEYFKQAARFVMLYRECLNKYGWLKLFENIAPQIETEEQKNGSNPSSDAATAGKTARQILLTGEQIKQMKDEYCAVNNGEFAPEVANEFVVLYLPEHGSGLQTSECINLVINMSEWMFANGYTCTKVSTIKK